CSDSSNSRIPTVLIPSNRSYFLSLMNIPNSFYMMSLPTTIHYVVRLTTIRSIRQMIVKNSIIHPRLLKHHTLINESYKIVTNHSESCDSWAISYIYPYHPNKLSFRQIETNHELRSCL